MATDPPTQTSPVEGVPAAGGPSSRKPDELESFIRPAGLGLLGAGAILSILLMVFAARALERIDIILGTLLALFLLGMSAYILSPLRGRLSRGERLRFQLLATLGGVGVLLAAYGLLLPFFAARYEGLLIGGPDKWRDNRLKMLLMVACQVGGLVVMFIGLQLARGYERTSAALRRLVYGYNMVVSSLVLAYILVLVNALSYVPVRPFSYFTKSVDFTSERIYSLKPASKRILESLDQPLRIYALLPQSDSELHADVQTLLENCKSANPSEIQVTFLSPDRNRDEVKQLRDKYKMPEPRGLLLVYGTEEPAPSEFIPRDDLMAQNASSQRGEEVFNGENTLINKVKYLSGGKTKTLVYFTQDNGELNIHSQARNRDEGLGRLTMSLGQENCEIKELHFGPKVADELKNADVVVIARPRRPFQKDAIDALRNYLKGDGKKKGKLLVMLDVQLDLAAEKPEMLQTGLEPLLAEYNVRVNNDRILCRRQRDPLVVIGITNPDSQNPIARAYFQEGQAIPFRFWNARSVQALPSPPTGPARYRAEGLVRVYDPQDPWSDTNLGANPVDEAENLRRNPERYEALRPKEPLWLAVAVTEPRPEAMPRNPHQPQPRGDQQPVLIAFGDATWVTNQDLGQANYSLFASCISWLSERADIGERAEPPQRKRYELTLTPEQQNRLLLLPGFLLLLAVVGLGGGIWVVRRR